MVTNTTAKQDYVTLCDGLLDFGVEQVNYLIRPLGWLASEDEYGAMIATHSSGVEVYLVDGVRLHKGGYVSYPKARAYNEMRSDSDEPKEGAIEFRFVTEYERGFVERARKSTPGAFLAAYLYHDGCWRWLADFLCEESARLLLGKFDANFEIAELDD